MELEVINISYEIEDDEGLSYLFFKTKNGYFSLSRLDGEDEIHLELDDQSKGRYFPQDCFDFDFFNEKIVFEIDEDLDIDAGEYQNITLIFKPIEDYKFKEAGKVLEKIFKERW